MENMIWTFFVIKRLVQGHPIDIVFSTKNVMDRQCVFIG